MKRIILLVSVMIVLLFYGIYYLRINEPDCIGSIIVNEEYDLQIVANRLWIKDEVSFAWTLYEKCINNTFYSTWFSYDIKGIPQKIRMKVYLWKRDVRKGKTIMEIEFRADESTENNLKKHELYIDGVKMD